MKLLVASKPVVFSLKNYQNINIFVCNAVLMGLCKADKVSEAFHLHYELLEKGLEMPLSSSVELKNGLEGKGKSK